MDLEHLRPDELGDLQAEEPVYPEQHEGRAERDHEDADRRGQAEQEMVDDAERSGEGDREAALKLLERIPESAETRRIAAMARVEPVEDVETTLGELLLAVKDDDEARQRFVDLLEVLGPDDPRTAEWRRRLTSTLF